jgi:hypothetical protein
MSVNITLPLFGGPGHELEEKAPVDGQQLRQLGVRLNERLQSAADTIDRLLDAGWQTRVAVYDIVLHRAGVESAEEAARQLRQLGLDPEQFMIIEELEDEGE